MHADRVVSVLPCSVSRCVCVPLYVPVCVCDLCRDPERGWDSRRVKGVMAKLVRVKDPATATALEVAAGGRLYQVRPGGLQQPHQPCPSCARVCEELLVLSRAGP